MAIVQLQPLENHLVCGGVFESIVGWSLGCCVVYIYCKASTKYAAKAARDIVLCFVGVPVMLFVVGRTMDSLISSKSNDSEHVAES